MAGVQVKSEIGKLRKVILHRPGRELLNLTPDSLERLLFDDIPYLEVAQQEHDVFAQKLRDNGVEVLYLERLMADVIRDNRQVREQFIDQWLDEADIHTPYWRGLCKEYLDSHYADAQALVDKTMEGMALSEFEIDRSNMLVDLVSGPTEMIVDPMPNLYFTRDPFAMIGNGVSVNRMYSVTRRRETIYGDYIFKYHPDFAGTPRYYTRDSSFRIEGGDILNINDHVLAIGISQRTQPDAIDAIAKSLFNDETSTIDTVLAFDIPKSRAFMHLDTVFTQIDVDKFTVHPGILGPLQVFEITPGKDGELKVHEIDDTLENILAKYLGLPKVTLIQCAGGDTIAAEREQWNDGSNTLCIAPGVIVVYERNDVTNEVLRKAGLKVLEMPSAELSRGRGGPRCMSMPLIRED